MRKARYLNIVASAAIAILIVCVWSRLSLAVDIPNLGDTPTPEVDPSTGASAFALLAAGGAFVADRLARMMRSSA